MAGEGLAIVEPIRIGCIGNGHFCTPREGRELAIRRVKRGKIRFFWEIDESVVLVTWQGMSFNTFHLQQNNLIETVADPGLPRRSQVFSVFFDNLAFTVDHHAALPH